jgi:hypothetical protein
VFDIHRLTGFGVFFTTQRINTVFTLSHEGDGTACTGLSTVRVDKREILFNSATCTNFVVAAVASDRKSPLEGLTMRSR